MNDDSMFDEAGAHGLIHKPQEEVGEFYFRIHILMIVGSIVIYMTVISWMVWRLIIGGAYEFSVVPVVSCVLLAMILVATRSMVVIVWDGRPSAHKVEVFPAESKRVSVKEWLVSPSPPIGPLTGRRREP